MAKGSVVNILEISPEDKLFFTGPFTEISKTHITLKNATFKSIIFKIKTTEPKKYCVRPNQGIIGPQDSATATVILQPLDEELLSSSQGQHKFQILHTLKDDDVSLKSIEELWLSANHALVFHHKLRCYFETEIETQHRMKDKELQFNVSNLKDASNLITELRGKVDELKRQNTKLNISLSETQKRLDIALKPSQFPDLLIYIVVAILGWLFAKFIV